VHRFQINHLLNALEQTLISRAKEQFKKNIEEQTDQFSF
jgi:hypothetical protein